MSNPTTTSLEKIVNPNLETGLCQPSSQLFWRQIFAFRNEIE